MLVSKKWLSQTTLISALALHGLTACWSDSEQQEGVNEEVGAASSDDSTAAADDKTETTGEKPEASSDVLNSDDAEASDDVVPAESKMLMAEPPAAEAKATTPEPATTPKSTPAMAATASTGRTVYYVKSDRAALRDQPADNGKEMGELHRGDSIVAEVEGDWAKTSAAKFISLKDLSTKPVGRIRMKRDWNTGGATAGKKSH